MEAVHVLIGRIVELYEQVANNGMIDASLDLGHKILIVDVPRHCVARAGWRREARGRKRHDLLVALASTVALLAAAPFRKPHGVVQMFSACAQLAAACAAVMVWLSVPGVGRAMPGTSADASCPLPAKPVRSRFRA